MQNNYGGEIGSTCLIKKLFLLGMIPPDSRIFLNHGSKKRNANDNQRFAGNLALAA